MELGLTTNYTQSQSHQLAVFYSSYEAIPLLLLSLAQFEKKKKKKKRRE